MLQKNFLIIDDADLDYAIHYKSMVAVWQSNVLIDTGVIISYSKDAIKINDGYVLRKLCELRVQ
jgi:hypothetical protein